jgi:hypothetical protein
MHLRSGENENEVQDIGANRECRERKRCTEKVSIIQKRNIGVKEWWPHSISYFCLYIYTYQVRYIYTAQAHGQRCNCSMGKVAHGRLGLFVD